VNAPADEDLDAVAALTDGVRRSAYRVVLAAGANPVGRDDVAEALDIGRTLAAFHLDKLAEAGLVEVSFARRSGRSGPGAGRPAKLYRVAAAERTVSVPPRSYGTAAELLAESLDRVGADVALFDAARAHGRRVGAVTAASSETEVVELLRAHGYVPEASPDGIRLHNCPFHQLAEQFPPLICGMNLALLDGVLDGAGAVGWKARMAPAPGRCCVVVAHSTNKTD